MQTNEAAGLRGSTGPDLAQRPATGIARGATLIACHGPVPAAGARPHAGVLTDRRRELPGHCVRHREPGAQSRLRARAGRRAGGCDGAGARPLGRAGGVRSAGKARVGQISSAMMTWAVITLVPLTLIIATAAGPIASLLNPANPNAHCAHADMIGATSDMLEVIAPQIVLYGLSAILFGLLQAYRRFAGPTLAPVVSAWCSSRPFSPSCRWARGCRWLRFPSQPSLSCRWGPRSP